MSVRYCRARGPRCFKCWMFILSGPVDLFVLLCLMAFWISSVVSLKSGSGLRL